MERAECVAWDSVADTEESVETIDETDEGGNVCDLVKVEMACEQRCIDHVDDGVVHVDTIDREWGRQMEMGTVVMDGMGEGTTLAVDLVRRRIGLHHQI